MGFGDFRVIEEQNKNKPNKQYSDVGISWGGYSKPTTPTKATTPTTTTPSSTPKMSDEEAKADAMRRYAEHLKQTGDWDKDSGILKEDANRDNNTRVVYIENDQPDITEYINQLKAAAKTEGPFENPGLEDDSENDNEAIE